MLISTKEFKVLEYITADGKSPYAQWFMDLDPNAAAKISSALVRLMRGNISNVKWFKGIGEYKIDFGPGYRIYLAIAGKELIILLGGGTKKNQQKDIDRALSLFNDYKKRKKFEK
ncbi:MAG: type II toxin-antitoxin system RelE/ParE family toxin [Legionellales bacterium]|jgi:putative addiction module killer protein